MGTLTVSRLNDISSYRSTAYGLSGNDVMEVSLRQSEGYVSSKITLENLKKYISGSSSNYSYQLFDIYYRAINETPKTISIIDGIEYATDFYSAWPLFINNSAGTGNASVNTAAPNWIGKWYNVSSPNTVKNTYTTFWNKLSELTQGFNINHADAQKYIKWDSVSVLNPNLINSSTYMSEYTNTSLGFTSRFLIDPINGFVALPILNNSFIRTLPTSGSFGGSFTDTLKSHRHSILDWQGDGMKGPGNGVSRGYAQWTQYTGENETAPRHVTLCPYMQIMNTYIMPTVVDLAPTLSAFLTIPTGAILTIPTTNELSGQGWLKCDGSAQLSAEFPTLYSVIGTTFGGSPVLSTFNLPSLSSQFIKYI